MTYLKHVLTYKKMCQVEPLIRKKPQNPNRAGLRVNNLFCCCCINSALLTYYLVLRYVHRNTKSVTLTTLETIDHFQSLNLGKNGLMSFSLYRFD